MICKTHTRSDIILCSVLFINILLSYISEAYSSQMFSNMIGKLPTLFKGVATCENWRERCKGVCSQNS